MEIGMPFDRHTSLEAVISSLNDPEEYFRGVLANMYKFKDKHGTAFVRMGATGKGKAPHYRIEPVREDVSLERALQQIIADPAAFEGEDAKNYIAFHGSSHKRLAWGSGELQEWNWCRDVLSIEGVKKLLGKVRGIPGA
jgi:hypothetical protein